MVGSLERIKPKSGSVPQALAGSSVLPFYGATALGAILVALTL